MKTAVEEGMQPYLPILEKRRIDLKIQLNGIFLKLDRNLIARIFSILMENALDVLPDGGGITVRDVVDDNSCDIEFSDTGPGISAEDLPFIFNPLFQHQGRRRGHRPCHCQTHR